MLEAIYCWQEHLPGYHVVFYIDNQAVAIALEALTNRSTPIMGLLWDLLGMAACLDFSFSSSWLSTKENVLANCASHFLYSKLFELALSLNHQPTSSCCHHTGIISIHTTSKWCCSTSGMDWHPVLEEPIVLAKSPSSTLLSSMDCKTPIDPFFPHPSQLLWHGWPFSEDRFSQRLSSLTSIISDHSMSMPTFYLQPQKLSLCSTSFGESSSTMARKIASPSSPSLSMSSINFSANLLSSQTRSTDGSMQYTAWHLQLFCAMENSQ